MTTEEYEKQYEELKNLSNRVTLVPYPETPQGWYPLIRALIKTLDTILDIDSSKIKVTQIKEKFGGLRFYYHIEDTASESRYRVDGAVSMAEAMSRITCGVCGDRKNGASRVCDRCDAVQSVHGS